MRYLKKTKNKLNILRSLTLNICMYSLIPISLQRVFHGIRLLRLED